MIRPDLTLPIPEHITSAHFIGIGGSGMSGIAHMFLNAGIRVSGSDRSDSPALAALAEAGATVFVGHDASNLGDADTVIHTGAIWPDNPEYLAAKERGLAVIHRSQALYWVINAKRLVSVAGAHGKTTSTGMLVTALHKLGVSPNFVSGGVIAEMGVSSGAGSDELFVIEADESDGTFELYDTSVALITNVDPDHVDYFGSDDAFFEAFVRFANAAREAVVISADDPGAIRVRDGLAHPKVMTFGTSPASDVRLSDVSSDAGVAGTMHFAGANEEFRLNVPGVHNALNAAGVVATLIALGHEFAASVRAVEAFAGTVRRFELHGVVRGVSVYDDYAHHPTEVRAALEAARGVVGSGRIIAIEQPHTYSRTQHMYKEFAAVLEELADHTVMLDVYGAREDPVPGVTGELVSGAFVDQATVSFVPDWQEAAEVTARIAKAGDFVITLGCGNVNLIIPQVLAALREDAQ